MDMYLFNWLAIIFSTGQFAAYTIYFTRVIHLQLSILFLYERYNFFYW